MARLVFGIQSAREAIRVRGAEVQQVLVQAGGGAKLEALARYAEAQGISVQKASRSELDRRAAGGRHQGVILVAPELRLYTLEQIPLSSSTVLVALDGITDPQN